MENADKDLAVDQCESESASNTGSMDSKEDSPNVGSNEAGIGSTQVTGKTISIII